MPSYFIRTCLLIGRIEYKYFHLKKVSVIVLLIGYIRLSFDSRAVLLHTRLPSMLGPTTVGKTFSFHMWTAVRYAFEKSPSLYVIPFTLLHINIKAVIEILARPSGIWHREGGGLRIDRILSYETISNELSCFWILHHQHKITLSSLYILHSIYHNPWNLQELLSN